MTPLVSVVIPTYNRATYLPEAIESVLSQTFGDLELIVVDDGSTDRTAEAVRRYGNERIRYIYQTNEGRSAARNRGVQLARGEFLGFVDSDDRLLCGAVEAHLRVFSQHGDLGMTIGGYQYVDETGQPLGERCPWDEGGSLRLPHWLFNCYAMPGSVLLRRSWFERVGGFDPNWIYAEEWDLFLRLAQAGCSMEWVREPVCQYRQHPGSSVRAVALHRDGALRMMDKYFSQQDLPPEIAALEKSVRAWVYVVFCKRAFVYAQPALGEHYLKEALRLAPEWAGCRRIELLEFLFAPGIYDGAGSQRLSSVILAHFPPEIRLGPGNIRRALARVEMAQFFRAVKRQANAEALQHLKAGLRRDPLWLANRGVVVFGLKQALSGLAARLSTRFSSLAGY